MVIDFADTVSAWSYFFHIAAKMVVLRVMMELDSGNHANVPGVDLFPVSAVKIQVYLA